MGKVSWLSMRAAWDSAKSQGTAGTSKAVQPFL